MKVECIHKIDSSEPDKNGMYEYYYEYDIYTFSYQDQVLVARSYIDDPQEAHFLSIEKGGENLLLCKNDLQCELATQAKSYLADLGKSELNWLSGEGDGYTKFP